MKKNNFKVKESLSIADKINMINQLVAGYFNGNDYTPYFREIDDIISFFMYCVEGLKFDTIKNDDGTEELESVYEAVTQDKELMAAYNMVKSPYQSDSTLASQLEQIDAMVKDIVEFEKQRLVFSTSDINELLMDILDKESRNKDEELVAIKETTRLAKAQAEQTEYANKVNECMTPEETAEISRRMLNGELDYDDMMQEAADAYLKSSAHKSKQQSVRKAQNKKVKSLEEFKKEHPEFNIINPTHLDNPSDDSPDDSPEE